MNTAYSAGYVTGILFVVVIVAFIFKFANTNKRMKTEYDERQAALRGKAYQYAFYTAMFFECCMIMIDTAGIRLPVQSSIVHFAGLLLACMVLATYCVWHDVYWGLNNNRRRYAVVFIVLALFNAFPLIPLLQGESLFHDGKADTGLVNLMVLVMLLVLGIELLIKHFLEKKTQEEET